MAFVRINPGERLASRVVEISAPEAGPGEVTVDVCHAGINFEDVLARRGDVMEWPFLPGLEVAGTVCALGRGASGLHVGQSVAAFTGGGGLAEVAAADRPLVQPVPEG